MLYFCPPVSSSPKLFFISPDAEKLSSMDNKYSSIASFAVLGLTGGLLVLFDPSSSVEFSSDSLGLAQAPNASATINIKVISKTIFLFKAFT